MIENIHILVYFGLLFLVAQLSGRLANLLNTPRLVGYLVAGILLGPSFLNVFTEILVENRFQMVTDIALAIIAFSIGGSLKFSQLKNHKRSILWITILQAGAAGIFVFSAVWLLAPYLINLNGLNTVTHKGILVMALILGAISTATAPAAILSLVHEYRAKGSFTAFLLGIVALDDAIALILYAFASTLALSIINGVHMSWLSAIGNPLLNTFIAILLGILAGFILKGGLKFLTKHDALLGFVVGMILITSGVALSLNVSPLLATMMLGYFVANHVKHKKAQEAFSVVEDIEEGIFGAFFLLAGLHLDFSLAFQAVGLAIVITFARLGGKLFGTWIGATVGHAPLTVKKYLGLGLLPTAGVAIGLALDASATFSKDIPELTRILVSSIIGATLLNELLTPYILRFALTKAGDIQPMEKTEGK